MHFLSSFWIRWITRFTVSRILSSLGLLDGVLFLSPNRVLSLEFCWSFFIGYSPVQQSLQEYLGVLVGNHMKPWWRVHSTSSMGLKGVLDWIFNRIIPREIIQKETSREFILGKFYLNLICGGVLKTHLTHHREKHVFRDLRLASLWHFQSEKHFWVWTSLQLSGCWVGNPISHSLTPLGSSKSMWVLPLLKLRSRYETDWMMVISCEGNCDVPSSCW